MKNFIPKVLLLACSLTTLPAFAGIIINNSTQGLYNNGLGDLAAIDGPGGFFLAANVAEGDPAFTFTTDPALAFTPAFGTNWLAGNYTGGTWSGAPVAIPSTWAVNTETAIVYDFSLAAISNLHIDLGVDNGILVWLNGNFLFGAISGGSSSINEYDLDIAGLAAGNHSLQLIRADHGGGTGFDISVEATDAPSRVPEPGVLMLLMTGLAGLFSSRKKQS